MVKLQLHVRIVNVVNTTFFFFVIDNATKNYVFSLWALRKCPVTNRMNYRIYWI